MTAKTMEVGEVLFVDSGATNHMTSHEEWFMNIREPEKRGVVETGNYSTHTIEKIDDVPFNNNGNNNYIKDVLHVPTITKKFVFVG
jgi:hypothetical protein